MMTNKILSVIIDLMNSFEVDYATEIQQIELQHVKKHTQNAGSRHLCYLTALIAEIVVSFQGN